jgi:hypothetical protein
MSIRRTFCPKCNSTRVKIVKEHNPDTNDMNMDVTLQCEYKPCKHTWEGRVMSRRTRDLRRRGRIRV